MVHASHSNCRKHAGSRTQRKRSVDLGDLDDVTYADEFVLIGEQMQARIDADEVAAQRRTINYEVTTALRDRLPRVHLPEAAANAG